MRIDINKINKNFNIKNAKRELVDYYTQLAKINKEIYESNQISKRNNQ